MDYGSLHLVVFSTICYPNRYFISLLLLLLVWYFPCNEVLKYRPKPHSVSPKLIGPFEFVITGEAMKNENLKSAFLLGIFIFMGMACLGFFLGTNMTTLKAC